MDKWLLVPPPFLEKEEFGLHRRLYLLEQGVSVCNVCVRHQQFKRVFLPSSFCLTILSCRIWGQIVQAIEAPIFIT